MLGYIRFDENFRMMYVLFALYVICFCVTYGIGIMYWQIFNYNLFCKFKPTITYRGVSNSDRCLCLVVAAVPVVGLIMWALFFPAVVLERRRLKNKEILEILEK